MLDDLGMHDDQICSSASPTWKVHALPDRLTLR